MDGQPRLPAHLSSIHHNPGRNRPAAYSGDSMTHPVLTSLGLSAVESGTYLGNNEWAATADAGVIETFSPASGELLARVNASSAADYAQIMERSEEHTSELQSLMRISYAVFCLKKKKKRNNDRKRHHK